MQIELDEKEGRKTRFQRRSELEGSDEDSEGVEIGPRTYMRYKKDLLWTNVLCGELSCTQAFAKYRYLTEKEKIYAEYLQK